MTIGQQASMSDTNVQQIVELAFEKRQQLTPQNVEPAVKKAITETIEYLDRGKLRVAEKKNGEWIVHDWIKKAILLSFRIEDN
jgi:2,3,4,5-tetrahydropyridine-2-carboxylate N-succinyltransferase